jgi:ABC-type Fe3+/spermidine/putrescine transport system ATPase subunit
MAEQGGVAISLDGIAKSFGSFVAVEETHLDIRDG